MEPQALVSDDRSPGEKMAWRLLGAPLYYCEACLRKVRVSTSGVEPIVERACDHHDHRIIAPRKAIVAGEGGLNFSNRVKLSYWQAAARLTGRSV